MNTPPQFTYLKHLASLGGPDFKDYDELTACFHAIGDHLRQGRLTQDELASWWRELGEAFSSPLTIQGLVFLQPHGHAGDFEIIERVCRYWKSPHKHLYRWDFYFQQLPLAVALRERNGFFWERVLELLRIRSGEIHILILGCGSARDVQECCQIAPDIDRLHFDCMDANPDAIAYAKTVNEKNSAQIRFICGDALNFNFEKHYDFIWSPGMFEYLDDARFCTLLNRLLHQLKPAGELGIVHLSSDNPNRDYMEAFSWQVQHRTEEQLLALARSCALAGENVAIEKGTQPGLYLRVWNGDKKSIGVDSHGAGLNGTGAKAG